MALTAISLMMTTIWTSEMTADGGGTILANIIYITL